MLAFDPADRLSAQECLLRSDVFGDGGGGDAKGPASAEASRESSDATSRAVFGPVDGGGGGREREGCGGSAATVSDLGDSDFVVEMDAELNSKEADATEAGVGGDGDDDDEYGGYADEEYDDDDDDDGTGVGKNGPGASASAAATPVEGEQEPALSEQDGGPQEGTPGDAKHALREGLAEEPVPPPPEEAAFLGEPGYVRKRVDEIEQKEEYFKAAAGGKRNVTADGAGEEEGKPAPGKCAAGDTTTETDGGEPAETAFSGRSGEQKRGETERKGSTAEEDEPASTAGGQGDLPRSYKAFDAGAATAAAAAASTAAVVSHTIVSAALVDAGERKISEGRQDEGRPQDGKYDDRPGKQQAQHGEDGDQSIDRGEDGDRNGIGRPGAYDDQGNSPTDPQKADVGTKDDDSNDTGIAAAAEASVAFGEDGYDSESFDDGGEEDGATGGLAGLAGRTSFFPDKPPAGAEEDGDAGESASGTGDANTDTGAASPGATPDEITGPLPLEAEDENPNTQPEDAEKGDANSGSGAGSRADAGKPQEDGGATAGAVADERAEQDEGEDGDGWRVAGAFRVLAASGPGGELAARAVKDLLRREAGEESVLA